MSNSTDNFPAWPGFGSAVAPVAPRRGGLREYHGVVDHLTLNWMRDHEDPALEKLLEAEAEYARTMLAPIQPFADQIAGEIKARTQEDDLSVPYRKGAWWYRSRTVEGLSYPIAERLAYDGSDVAPTPETEGQVVLDQNALAEGHEYLVIGAAEVSPDGNLLAYLVDFDGSETHTLHVRDLRTGSELAEAIDNVSYGLAWSADSASLLYTTLDESQRPWRVHHHRLTTPADGSADVLIYEELDDQFWVNLSTSRSGELIVVEIASAVSSEIRLIDTSDIAAGARLGVARRANIEVQVDHHGSNLYIISNDGALNFALWRAPLHNPERHNWVPLISHDPTVRLLGVSAFESHLVIDLRRDGRPGLRFIDLRAAATVGAIDVRYVEAHSRDLTFDDASYSLGGAANEEWTSASLRFTYQSLITPPTLFEESLDGKRQTLKQQLVIDYDPTLYATQLIWATAPDGVAVPVSVAYARSTQLDGTAPLVLYGYGAYEISSDAWFSTARLSLLDRGVVFAVAHVRGGGEMGRGWYEDGKLEHKASSFSDFVASAEALMATQLCDPQRIAIRGGSAGGLLVGAATNLAPEMFRVVVAEVPFVDALNTILDPEAPLTAIEWEEWGNPITDPRIFALMRSYAPTENVKPVRYPAVLATGGRQDPRVGVHEPAIWVQRLRELSHPESGPAIFQVELGSGHGGPSGRYEAWQREAEVLAFILTAVGQTNSR